MPSAELRAARSGKGRLSCSCNMQSSTSSLEACAAAKSNSRRRGQLFFRIRDQFPEHLDGGNTWRLERIFCGIAPNRRSVEWSPVFIVFGGAAIQNKHVL